MRLGSISIILRYWPVQKDVPYVHGITFDTSSDCRMVRDFEKLPVVLFAGWVNGGLGESCKSTVDPCWVVELRVPTEGYNHASHHVSVGEVTAGWCTMWHMAKGRTTWDLKRHFFENMSWGCSPSISKHGIQPPERCFIVETICGDKQCSAPRL